MKIISFILVINFLIYHGAAEVMLSGALNTFLSYLGVGPSAQYEEISTVPDPVPDPVPNPVPNPAPDVVLDIVPVENDKTERIYEPLELIFVSFEGTELMATIGNSKHLREDFRSSEFVDAEFACPKKEDEKEVPTLVIERSYISFVDKYIKEAKLSKETSEDNSNEAEDGENGKIDTSNTTQKQQPNQDIVSNQEHVEKGDASELTSMEHRKETFIPITSPSDEDFNTEEPDSSPIKKKFKRKESHKRIPEEHEAVLKKSRVDSVDQREENSLGENKMEIDLAPTLKLGGNDIKETETDSAPNQKIDAASNQPGSDSTSNQKSDVANLTKTSSLKSDKPAKLKIRRSEETFTFETKPYWFKAVKDVENFKCDRPVKPLLVPHSSSSTYTIYIVGFDVYLKNHDDLKYEEFRNESNRNRKYTFFWSFTMIFNNIDRSVCVYHVVQYNDDTYNPKINENFNDHDLGKDKMFPELDISQLYEIENQEMIFNKLFKNEDERKKYLNVKEGRYLKKLHLAPLHGFITPVVRQSAKTYGNVAPMWKSIKTGAWNKLEEHVNALSSVLKHLVVITGTYGILKLNGKEVYLANDKKIPIPLAYWKMVIYQDQLEIFPGILFVTSNNPYEDIGNVICEEDKCGRFGWGYVRETELSRGRTICCDFTPRILSKVPILNGAQPSSVLNWTNIREYAKKIWEFDEEGERTTPEQFETILERFTRGRDLDEEMIAEEQKAKELVKNENAEIEDAENKDPNKIKAIVPLVTKELEKVPFPTKHVAIK